jgi:hypothetical protein
MICLQTRLVKIYSAANAIPNPEHWTARNRLQRHRNTVVYSDKKPKKKALSNASDAREQDNNNVRMTLIVITVN